MSDHRVPPDWLVPEPYSDTDLGVLKTGKEAQVSLVERTGSAGQCLLARKFVEAGVRLVEQQQARIARDCDVDATGELCDKPKEPCPFASDDRVTRTCRKRNCLKS